MGKVWPIGPNDEPAGWFDKDLNAESDGNGNYAVRPPYQPVAPHWIRASFFGWTLFALVFFWWLSKLALVAFFLSGFFFMFASYATYRAARLHIDDLVSAAWEEVVQSSKLPTR